MTRHVHRATCRRVHRLFTDGLDLPHFRGLMGVLSACAGCAEHYRRYHALETALCGTAPTPFALERIEAEVLATAGTCALPMPWGLERSPATQRCP